MLREVEAAIESVGGAKTSKLRDEVKKFREALEEQRTAVTKAEVQASSNDKAIAKCDKAISDKTAQITAHTSAVELLDAELQQLTSDAFEVMEAYKQSQATVEQRATDLKEKRVAFENMEKQLAQVGVCLYIVCLYLYLQLCVCVCVLSCL